MHGERKRCHKSVRHWREKWVRERRRMVLKTPCKPKLSPRTRFCTRVEKLPHRFPRLRRRPRDKIYFLLVIFVFLVLRPLPTVPVLAISSSSSAVIAAVADWFKCFRIYHRHSSPDRVRNTYEHTTKIGRLSFILFWKEYKESDNALFLSYPERSRIIVADD